MPRGPVALPLPLLPGGVREDVNPSDLPEGAFVATNNYLVRQGVGRTRPGYVQLGATLPSTDAVLGFGFRGSPSTTPSLVEHTATAAYSWNGGTHTDITGTWGASLDTELVRFATYQSSGILYLLRVNEANALGAWPGTGSFAVVGGSPPRARDIMILGRRAVLMHTTDGSGTYPFRVHWSGFNDLNTWAVDAFNDINETPDVIIGGKAFGPLSGAVYKEDTLWLMSQQDSVSPFQFQLITYIPGPVSPAAIVPYLGHHYWLGKDGAIYTFDGSRPDVVSQGLITTMRETFSRVSGLRTHGFVLALQQPEIWWVYPDASTGAMVRVISLNLTTRAVTAHIMADEITASSEYISQADVTWDSLPGTWDTLDDFYPTWDSMGSSANSSSVLGGTDGKVYQFGIASSDNLDAIPWFVDFGWKTLGNPGDRFYFDGVESYWTKMSESQPVTISIRVTNSLGENDIARTKVIDLEQASDHFVQFPNLRGQWVRLRISSTSASSNIAHRATIMRAWPRRAA